MSTPRPKVRLSRRIELAVTPKAARCMGRREGKPGMHGNSRRRSKLSNYGAQLLEKQRLRYQYNISEKQLRNTYKRAIRKRGNTADELIQMLECRLDALVLRGGLAKTIYQARQFVVHGHIHVNGKKVDRPSYAVAVGDVIKLSQSELLENSAGPATPPEVPAYLSSSEDHSVELTAIPERDQIPVICEVGIVIEYYSA